MEGGTGTSSSTAIVSGVKTKIGLLVVIVLKRVLRVVKVGGYRIRLAGSGVLRGV
jgi:hypothetical protein